MLRGAALMAFLAVNSKAVDGVPVPTPVKEIAVGDHAPAFTLKDQTDKEYSLEAMLKKGPVAVVFIRSVDWCTYCQLQSVQISDNLPEIEAGGGQVVMICYDAPEKVKRFAERRKLRVPVLSDVDSKTIDAYAMRALRAAGDQTGSAIHGTFIIDQAGIVRAKPYLTSFEGREAVDTLVNALKEAAKPNKT